MVLTFNCKPNADSYVYTPDREAQYIVKTTYEPKFSAGVYDDLGLSQLVNLEKKEDGIHVSAFDSPVGVFKPHTDCFCKMEGEDWKILNAEDNYVLYHQTEQIAEIAVSGNSVAVSTEYSGQAIMVIAAALVVLELNRIKASEKTSEPKKVDKSIEKKAIKSEEPQKEKSDPIITINTEALKKRLAKFKMDKAVTVATEYIPSIHFKVKGKVLIAMVSVIALCLVVFFSGLFLATSNTKRYNNLDYTNAIAKVSKSEGTTAIFRAGEYAYTIDLPDKGYKNNETFLIYYTENLDGTLKEYFLKKPASDGYVTMSSVAIVLAVVVFLLMFIGNPLEFRREWNFKEVIKKLKPTPQVDEEDRLVEHTAYVSSADIEPDFFGVNKKDD